MLLGQSPDQGQAQAGAVMFARQRSVELHKGLEEPGLIFRRNPGSVILHGKLDGPARRPAPARAPGRHQG